MNAALAEAGVSPVDAVYTSATIQDLIKRHAPRRAVIDKLEVSGLRYATFISPDMTVIDFGDIRAYSTD